MSLINAETGEVVADCTPEEARVMTDEVKTTAGQLWQQVQGCIQRRAWRALGYSTPVAYLMEELGIGQRQAYNLLDQAKVMAELTAAAGVECNALQTHPQRAVADLKPHLNVVRERVEEATRDTEPELRAEAAEAAVDQFRRELDAAEDAEREDEPLRPAITKPDLGGGISHPARYSDAILDRFAELLADCPDVTILDPFAGTGRIHELSERLPVETVGVELEPEFAELHPATILGNALELPWEDPEFDVVATSPTYGNRLADSHNASDPEARRSYTHDLGRKLSDDNSGAMQWGPAYREFHRRAWAEAVRVLLPDGLFLLNIKDHVRGGVQQTVTAWHVAVLTELGLELDPELSAGVPTRHLRQGADSERAGQELVLVFRRAA